MSPAARVHATFVGGGPAGLAPLVWAARHGLLRRLAAAGLVVIERGPSLGVGTIGRHAIGSDTLADTFLECLEDCAEPRLAALREHPAAAAVAAHRGGPVPLPVVAVFLQVLGEALGDAITDAGGRILRGCEALWNRRRADGLWQTRFRSDAGEGELLSRTVVLGTGADQRREVLDTLPVAGTTLLPRFAEKLLVSGEVLAAGGGAEIARRLAGVAAPRVAIIGGSHSAVTAANLLLHHGAGVAFGEAAITLLHRRPLRVFYPSVGAAAADGYLDFDRDDVCPVSQRLFRLAGFRLEARELVMRALGVGGRAPEPRLRLHRLQGEADWPEAVRLLEQADLVIAALGYRPNALPCFDLRGHRVPLAKDAEPPGPLVDRQCRVLDANRRPIPGLLGIGLAAGFVPSGALGGEPSFRGQANGLWLWQNGVGAIIVDSLLREADDVAA